MKKILCLGLLLGLHTHIHAQRLTLTDAQTRRPLEMATLADRTLQTTVTTDAKGQVDISAFQASDTIIISLLGYRTETRSYAQLADAGFALALVPGLSLDQVVVSATRWRQRRSDVPARIITISPADVALQQPQTAADMLGQSGEVFIQKSQQGGGSPMIRGFSTNRLLYSVDGVRMNTAIFRSGNLQNVISLDPFAVENAEVLFGPGSVIYGSDAIGGVMSFQTRTPRLSDAEGAHIDGHFTARYASANQEKTGHFDVGIGWKKWALLTSFTSSDYSDLRQGTYGPDDYLRPYFSKRIDSTDVLVANDDPLVQTPTGYGQINLMQKVRFQPRQDWDLQYGFHYATTTEYDRYDRLLRTRNGLPQSAEWRYGPQVWSMHNLSAAHSTPNALYDQMTLRAAFQHFEESRIDRDWNDPERRTRTEMVEAWSVNADFVKAFPDKHQIAYGAEVVINDVTSTGVDADINTGESTAGPSRYPQSNWASYALYANYQWTPSARWLLQAGGRYNLFRLHADFSSNLDFYPLPFSTVDNRNGALTGSLGAVFHAPGDWEFAGSLTTGFRAPNVDDVGKVFDSEPGAVVVPNPGLEPEYAYNAEIDVAKVWGERLKVDVCAYYTLLDQAMVRRDYTLNGQDSIVYDGEPSRVQAIQNAAQARVYGLQAGVEWKIVPGLLLYTQVNYQQGEEALDNGETSPMRHAAPWFGVTRLTYRTSGLTLQLYGMHNGEVSYENLSEEGKATDYLYAQDKNGNPYSPAWYTLNIKSLYTLSDHWTIGAGVENLTDQRYRPYSSGLSAAGRNVVLSLNAVF